MIIMKRMPNKIYVHLKVWFDRYCMQYTKNICLWTIEWKVKFPLNELEFRDENVEINRLVLYVQGVNDLYHRLYIQILFILFSFIKSFCLCFSLSSDSKNKNQGVILSKPNEWMNGWMYVVYWISHPSFDA